MTLAVGVLAIGDDGLAGGFMASRPALIGEPAGSDAIFRLDAQLDRPRWTDIVVHHLGQPAGDADSIRQLHLSYGYQSLGYQFLIGNGRGMGDGDIYVGERWIMQQPGAHTVGPQGEHLNQHAIGICLIGNGDRQPFSDRQLTSLIGLIQRLQMELEIPASHVHLHRDVAPGVSSPGHYFPAARLREQLVDRPR